jgi:hypothetical protein
MDEGVIDRIPDAGYWINLKARGEGSPPFEKGRLGGIYTHLFRPPRRIELRISNFWKPIMSKEADYGTSEKTLPLVF